MYALTCQGYLVNLPPKAWTLATVEDARLYQFSTHPHWGREASPYQLADILEAEDGTTKEPTIAGHARVRALLIAALRLDTRPHKPRDPYGAMSVVGDRSTAVPEDWRAGQTDVLDTLGKRADHPVVRARLLDLTWHIDRRRVDAGAMAAEAYFRVASGLRSRMLTDAMADDVPALLPDSFARALQRGLQICELMKGKAPEACPLSALVEDAYLDFERANDTEGLRKTLGLMVEFNLARCQTVHAALKPWPRWCMKTIRTRAPTTMCAPQRPSATLATAQARIAVGWPQAVSWQHRREKSPTP